MSGRGGGRRGGGRGGFGGRGGAQIGPVARDDDGTVLATAPAGPPPLFPEIELPEHPDISPKDKMLLPTQAQQPGQSQQGEGAGAGGSGSGPRVGTKRSRPLLSSVMTLLPDYFPEDLYSTKEMRASRLQTLRGQDAYFRAQSGRDDATGLRRLEQLAKLESNAEEGGAVPGGRKGGEGEEDDGPPEEEVLHDTDEEEDMEFDDYYQGEHFDDDEGYGDADEGGDDGPVY
ncbi:hypothetical protein TSOC_011653 [Tetrabaena socialis]|uniref:DNA-directed RNA polymerase III subunit n=1 Tax=Tetrabaena socialis TaxID=47790 RepID=A0A2J7ZQ33_9CHLO|nr:hypothetical protein TSOC_011653 [Tetrabaena socialis]|eukprot:PNH02375.1 hypothetical protein TSOC_011653 [Tetrabaena socialis]